MEATEEKVRITYTNHIRQQQASSFVGFIHVCLIRLDNDIKIIPSKATVKLYGT
jgi:hypothetical protein